MSVVAARIVSRLDELGRFANAGNADATAKWSLDEGQWVSDNMTQLLGDQMLTDYMTSTLALRDAVGAPIYSGTNEMQRVRIASMLGL